MNPDRILHLYDTISNVSVAPILESIININNGDDNAQAGTIGEFGQFNRDPIHLFISSGGGQMYDVNSLLSIMESSITPVYTYCPGYAMSAGLTLFVGGHKRFAGKHSTFMIHQPTEPLGEEKYFVLKNRLDETERLMNMRIKYICSRTKLTEEDFERNKHIDWFMNAEQALEYGIVHEII